jgi:hypothetical protein
MIDLLQSVIVGIDTGLRSVLKPIGMSDRNTLRLYLKNSKCRVKSWRFGGPNIDRRQIVKRRSPVIYSVIC